MTRRRLWIALVALAALGAILFYTSLPDVRGMRTSNPTTTAFIEIRRLEASRAGRSFTPDWRWTPVEQISPYLRFAVVATEDAHFYQHDGLDFEAIERAVQRNLREGRLSSGGSTITQQLAKNLFLSPSKDPIRKLREAAIARRLEDELGKKRILELYLNVCEWGDGVFGAEAASQKYFGHSASQLTPSEAARLALALPNPRALSPLTPSTLLDLRAGALVNAMRRSGMLDEAARVAARHDLGLRH